MNLSKGGYTKVYRNGKLDQERSGVSTSIKGADYTANWMKSTGKVEVKGDRIVVKGNMKKKPGNQLDFNRFLLLRMFQKAFGRFPAISLMMKDKLIDRLIKGDFTGKEFERVIDLETYRINDDVEGDVYRGEPKSSMFIPNSEYGEKESFSIRDN